MHSEIVFKPSRDYVQNLQVGDHTLNCFGKLAEVVSIHGRGNDLNGKAYVCFYTKMSETSSVSGSLKEGELVRTVGLCHKYTSRDLDTLEKDTVATDKVVE